MLTSFGEDIWLADGPTVSAMAGFHYPTRMVIIRLTSGGLFVWSPIALSAELRAAVDALGPIRHIVAPNALHHLFIPDWMAAYPDAQAHAAPGLSAKRGDIAFHTELSGEAHADWAGDIDQVIAAGNRITEEVIFFHRKSGTAIFADLLQHLPKGWYSGWRSVVAKMDLMTGDEPAAPRKFRLAFTKRKAARAAIAPVLNWPTKKVVIAHGAPVEADGQAFLKRAFNWLIK